MAAGARHDEYGVRHEATFRRRLARAEQEVGRLQASLRLAEPGEAVPLLIQLRNARARVRRLRLAPKFRSVAGS